ncbi:MAG: hypothetical protein ABL876_04625 [Chitinophagaceae bacterium]
MKKLLLLLLAIGCLQIVSAQLKTTAVCPAFTVDVLGGKINDLYINSTFTEFKTTFPCFTSMEEENSSSKCGGVIFFKDKDIYLYTGRDYVEIREKFKGKLSLPLLGASRTALFKWLGHPKIKDVSWDAFQTAYGSLILYYNKAGKIIKLQMSTKSTESIQLCE